MEPIPVFFEMVERTAVAIAPKQPFWNWLISIDPKLATASGHLADDGPTVYLLPGFDEMKDLEKWFKKNFDKIFTDQMNNWYTDERLWQPNRTFALFKEWFTYSLFTMVMDTVEGEIEKI